MSLGNPQSFNRYSYVENEPTDFVDPSGLQLRTNSSSFGVGIIAVVTIQISWFERIWDERYDVSNSGSEPCGGGGTRVPDEADSRGGGNGGNPFPNIKEILNEASKAAKQRRECLRKAREKAKNALKENAKKYPYDSKLVTKAAWNGLYNGGAAAGGTAMVPGGQPFAIKVGLVTGGITFVGNIGDRVIERVDGWYQVVWEWQKDATKCGYTNGLGVPDDLNFPY